MIELVREPVHPTGCVDDCGSARPTYRRGLTRRCYNRHRDAGDLDDYPPRRPGPRTTLLADAMALRRKYGRPDHWAPRDGVRYGITWREVAERLGVTYAAVDKARERAGYLDVSNGGPPARGRWKTRPHVGVA